MTTAVELYRPMDFTVPQQLALQALSAGWSKSTAAKIAGVSRPTLYRWIESTPGFDEAARNAFEQATDELEEVARTIAVDERNPGMVRWLLASRRPAEYPGERRSITLDGEVAVRVEERQAQMIAAALVRTLNRLGLPTDQEQLALAVLSEELRAIEAEQARAESVNA